MFAVTDIPDLLLSSCGTISNTQMSAASTTHRASLQQRCTFPRRGRSRQFVCPTVGREQLEILLILLPADVAGVSIRDAGEPFTVFVLTLDFLLAVDSSANRPCP